MYPLSAVLDSLRTQTRRLMRQIARGLHRISGGAITPNMITLVSLLAHLPIAVLIAQGRFGWAAGLLVVFGLMDTLDGELARLQGRASAAGMVLDATTDRMKEVVLFAGTAYFFIAGGESYMAVWAVLACGGSLSVSYVKAKGETAVKDSKLTANEINRLFQDGLLRYEVRMAVLVIGLLASQLAAAVIVIAILAWATALQRLIKITSKLDV